MPTLKQILQTCSSKDDRLLRARALECATLFGVAVDKAQFHDDAVQIMQFMMHQQKSGLSFDDPLRSYMLQGWARIGRSFGAEFSQYLNMIMPSLLEAASVEAD
jgi:protein-disulfide isomerase-like protein with CxxC motif